MSANSSTVLDPAAAAKTLTEQVGKLTAAVESISTQAKGARSGKDLLPHIRKGENPLSSRGYSFTKLFQLMGKQIGGEDAKVELDMHNRLHKELFERRGFTRSEPNTILAPLGSEFFPIDSESEARFAKECRDVVKAGVVGYDPQELREIRRKFAGGQVRQKTLSWTDETGLGALVEPPLMGELIELLRNNEVLLAAGARTLALPPQGRLVYPRQTGASTFYYVGENQQITDSEPTTGDLILQAKKGAVLIKVPNELFRYASVSVEMFLRMDMTKTMGLGMDKTLLEGQGTSNSPKGLINYAGINQYVSTGTPADANSGYPLQPEDIYNAIATVEEANAVFRSWIMRPLMYSYIANRRADAVQAGDSKGMFMFNILRELDTNMDLERTSVGNLSGYAAHKSTQISKTRTRGTGTTNNTYMLGGDFSDYVMAVAPTIEFALTNQGSEPFTNDQTWIRAILPHDAAPRHEASFVMIDNLLFS